MPFLSSGSHPAFEPTGRRRRLVTQTNDDVRCDRRQTDPAKNDIKHSISIAFSHSNHIIMAFGAPRGRGGPPGRGGGGRGASRGGGGGRGGGRGLYYLHLQ